MAVPECEPVTETVPDGDSELDEELVDEIVEDTLTLGVTVTEELEETDGLNVPEPDDDDVDDEEKHALGDPLGDDVIVPLSDEDAEIEVVKESDPVAEAQAEPVTETLADADPVIEVDPLDESDGECESVGDAVVECVAEPDLEVDGDAVPECEVVAHVVGDALSDAEGDSEPDVDGDEDVDGEVVTEPHPEKEGDDDVDTETDGDPDVEPVPETDPVIEGDRVGVCVTLPLVVTELDKEGLGLPDVDPDIVCECVGELESVTEGEPLLLTDGEFVIVPLIEGEPEPENVAE